MKSEKKDGRFSVMLFILVPIWLAAADNDSAQAKTVAEYFQDALKAYELKDYPAYLTVIRSAENLLPDHPQLMVHSARALALNGRPDDSCRILDRLGSMGLYISVEKEADFASLHLSSAFTTVREKFQKNLEPVGRCSLAWTIPEKIFLCEGIAYDHAEQSYFVSSVHRRKIVKINRDGSIHDFSRPEDGLYAALGMAVDGRRRLLWVATSAMPQMAGFIEADKGKAGIFAYDLKTGRLLQRLLIADRSKEHAFGDLAIDGSGNVYATDSANPDIYVIPIQTGKLAILLSDPRFGNLQGIAAAGTNDLYVSDYGARGIWHISLPEKNITQILPPAESTLLGIDGLHFWQGGLIAIQNGITPNRVVRILLNPQSTGIDKVSVLAANHPLMVEPTLGVAVENDFYFVATSQWPWFDEKGSVIDPQKLRPPEVLKIALK